MENPSVDRLSAVTRVVQQFTAACDQEKLSLIEAIDALVRFVGIESLPSFRTAHQSQNPSSNSGAPAISNTAPMKAENIQLTKEQAEKAKALARAEKAKRFGLSPREIQLTSQEAKEAKAKYRLQLFNGSSSASPSNPTQPKPSQATTPKSGSSGSAPTGKTQGPTTTATPPPPTTPSSGKEEKEKKPVGVALDPTGSRATQKTRIDNIRRLCLKALPVAVAEPTVLHLVAYLNHRNRLSDQWSKYRSTYADSGMLDPLRGLPDPTSTVDMPESKKLLELTTSRLRVHTDTPGTFVLQSEDGGSFWDRDRPSLVCPPEIARPLPEAVLGEFERLTGVNRF